MNYILIISSSILLALCTPKSEVKTADQQSPEMEIKNNLDQAGLEKAYFASGCFWCVEAIYESLRGVEEVISGYSGGSTNAPTYHQIGTGLTGHAEAVEVYYDPKMVSYKNLVEVFYASQDPTTVGQNPDFGSQYRSIIFYQNETEKNIAEGFKNILEQSGTYKKPIITEIVPFKKFWNAEDYHQDFERRNPNQSYVKSVSIPRLNRFKEKHPELLK